MPWVQNSFQFNLIQKELQPNEGYRSSPPGQSCRVWPLKLTICIHINARPLERVSSPRQFKSKLGFVCSGRALKVIGCLWTSNYWNRVKSARRQSQTKRSVQAHQITCWTSPKKALLRSLKLDTAQQTNPAIERDTHKETIWTRPSEAGIPKLPLKTIFSFTGWAQTFG